MNPTELGSKSKKELVNRIELLNYKNDELVDEMSTIRFELLSRLEEEKKDGEVIGNYSVARTKRVTFKTTLEQAEELGAVKKAVDSSVLRGLHNKGIKVPGVSETTYLSMRKLTVDK